LNCQAAERFDVEDLIDLYSSIEDGMAHNPHAMGVPHPASNPVGLWVYETPPVTRLPYVRILFEIVDDKRIVLLWSASFSDRL
jgi:hypothetical protein